MNDKFHELAKNIAQSVARRTLKKLGLVLAGSALVMSLALSAVANVLRVGPLIDLSDPDALAACGSNGRETEPCIAVNPTNQKNIVAAWFGGFSHGLVAAVSLDGGKKWQQVIVPGVTLCTGG